MNVRQKTEMDHFYTQAMSIEIKSFKDHIEKFLTLRSYDCLSPLFNQSDAFFLKVFADTPRFRSINYLNNHHVNIQ